MVSLIEYMAKSVTTMTLSSANSAVPVLHNRYLFSKIH
jgi:hypothetical protein